MTSDEFPCPVCGSRRAHLFAKARDVEYYTSDRIFTYLACGRCGSLYLDSPPHDLRQIYPPNYYSYRYDHGPASFTERIKQYLDARLFSQLLRHIGGDHLNALDVGGGSGWLLTLLRRLSPRIDQTHEVDLDEGARQAAEAAGHTFHSGRIEDFHTTMSFDLILMLNLIEHVRDPGAVLQSMRNLLSPGGIILIKTPNIETLDCRLFRHHNWGGFHCPRHFVLFNRQSLVDLGHRCGLHAVKVSYTQGAPQWACSILGWLGLKGLIDVSADRPLYTHKLYPSVCGLAAAFDLLRMPFMRTAQMFVIFRHKS